MVTSRQSRIKNYCAENRLFALRGIVTGVEIRKPDFSNAAPTSMEIP
jgi:hypothetical protein